MVISSKSFVYSRFTTTRDLAKISPPNHRDSRVAKITNDMFSIAEIIYIKIISTAHP
jgi:hypothetical protein